MQDKQSRYKYKRYFRDKCGADKKLKVIKQTSDDN